MIVESFDPQCKGPCVLALWPSIRPDLGLFSEKGQLEKVSNKFYKRKFYLDSIYYINNTYFILLFFNDIISTYIWR